MALKTYRMKKGKENITNNIQCKVAGGNVKDMMDRWTENPGLSHFMF